MKEDQLSSFALYLSTHGTKGLQLHSDQSRRIAELNKLIDDLQSNKPLTRSELEESLGDLMTYFSSTVRMHHSEMIEDGERNGLIAKLKSHILSGGVNSNDLAK